MSQPAKAQEPSMEEILASIRRIIADDDANKAAKPPEPVAPPAAAAPAPAPRPVAAPPRPAAPPAPAVNTQSAVDAMLAEADKAPPRPAPKPEVLDLTESQVAPQSSSSFRTIDGNSDIVFSERAPEPAAEPLRSASPAPAPASAPAPAPIMDRALLSGAAASAVDRAFNSLAHTVIGQNSRTLEDLVKEMLRPMLKSWLDDNLPGLVERIVRSEIERVSRGR